MPRLIDYPRGSFLKALDLAKAVESLGGQTSKEVCAHKMGKKLSGAFDALVGATIKHGLVNYSKGILTVTDLFKDINLSYTEEEKMSHLIKSFLLPPVYMGLYEKFKHREVPKDVLDKILIREFGVQDKMASRVSGYFLQGTKYTELLKDGKLVGFENRGNGSGDSELDLTDEGSSEAPNQKPGVSANVVSQEDSAGERKILDVNSYTVSIVGPNINSKVQISDEDDLLIVDVILKKIRKQLSASGEEG